MLKTSKPLNGVNQISSAKSLDKSATTPKMDKVIDRHAFHLQEKRTFTRYSQALDRAEKTPKTRKKRELLAKERTTRDCKSIDLHNRTERELQN